MAASAGAVCSPAGTRPGVGAQGGCGDEGAGAVGVVSLAGDGVGLEEVHGAAVAQHGDLPGARKDEAQAHAGDFDGVRAVGVFGQGGEVAGGERGEEHTVGQSSQVGVGQCEFAGGADDEERGGGGQGLADGAVGGEAALSGVDEGDQVGVDDVDEAAQVA